MSSSPTSTESIVNTFFKAFQNLDYATMQSCYGDSATFSDPVFGALNTSEVKAMWHMLCTSAQDFSLNFSIISHTHNKVVCSWIAKYTFSKTGKHVTNTVTSNIHLSNGKIASQHDHFNFWNWSRQALGFVGLILGWTPALRRKVRANARKNLDRFMQAR